MLLAITATLMVAGCFSREDTGNSAAATTITTNGLFPTIGDPISNFDEREPSCTWSPPTRLNGGQAVWVCGFNDNNTGGLAWQDTGWSWSTDATNWNYCFNGKNSACGTIPVPAGMMNSNGDPTVVADGEGNVVYVGIGTMTDGNSIVWAAMSTDSGKTFPNAIQVNTAGSACSPATDDQPSADFDITTPSTAARKISVVWLHDGSGTFGGCMRRGTFCATAASDSACAALPQDTVFPTIAWETSNGLDIGGMDRQDQLYGQGALIVQAGDGAVAVAAANCDHSMNPCPNTSLQNCGWERVLTYDGGHNWTNNVHFDDTTTLQTCVANGGSPPDGGRLQAARRGTFAFVRDRRNGDYYAATMHAKGDLRLFRSQNQGATWSQVREFSNPSVVPTIALPVLASDSAGRLALEYIQSDSADAQVQPVFATVVFDATNADPDPAPDPNNWAFDVLTPFFDPTTSNGVPTDVGDYNGIAVADPILDSTCTAQSSFLPAWTETFSLNDVGRVDGELMGVSP